MTQQLPNQAVEVQDGLIISMSPIQNTADFEVEQANEGDCPFKSIDKVLPVLKFQRQFMNNTKLSHTLVTKNIDPTKDGFDLKINERAVNLIDIWSDQNISLSNCKLSQYDLAVMDAVYTIIKHGYKIVTPEWILRVMSGNQKQKLTENKINKLNSCIQKLKSIHIKIDCTAEYNTYQLRERKKPVDRWTYESYLLPFGKAEAKYETNGRVATAYKILEIPALYLYAEMNHQIISVPACLFETQEQYNDTDEAILIKRYVVKRVAQIIRGNSIKSNKISYIWCDKNDGETKGLFPDLGYVDDCSENFRKNTKSKINKIVKGTLESLKQANAINNYEEYRADGTNNPTSPIMGYKISYNSKAAIRSA